MVEPGEEREAEDLEADDGRDRAVDPLDPRLGSRRAAGSAGRGTAASRGSPCRSPVARTTTPIVTSSTVVTTVAAASFWNRVTGGVDLGHDGWDAAANAADILRGRRSPADSRVPGYARAHVPLVVARVPRGAMRLVAVLVGALRVVAARAPRPTPVASSAPASPSVIPVIVSTEQVVGPNRFVFSFLDPKTNLPAASPDRTASVAFIAPGETEPGPAVAGDVRVGDRGRARRLRGQRPTFPHGRRLEGACSSPRRRAAARRRRSASAFHGPRDGARRSASGSRRPSTTNPTAADVGGDLAKISTDKRPDPAFYETTVADALAAHKPFVLVFATPAFCQSAQCGPTLDRVKAAAAAAPGRRRVHQRRAVPARLHRGHASSRSSTRTASSSRSTRCNQWGLVSEPWIFTVGGGRDREGLVRGRGRRRGAQGGDREDRGARRRGAPAAPGASSRRYTTRSGRPRGSTRGPATTSRGARRGGPAGTRRRSRACRS